MNTYAPTCSEMSDPTWCIEEALADIDSYDPDAPIPETIIDVLRSEAFRERNPFPDPPTIGLRGSYDDDSTLSRFEDDEGHERGTLAGVSFPYPDEGYAELHIGLDSAPLIVAHEAGHICAVSPVKQSHEEGHGPRWLEAFRAILDEVYPGTAEAFDRAVSGSEPCRHESVYDAATHEVNHALH